MAPSSDICIQPFSSMILLGLSGFSNNSSTTFFAIALLMVPFSIRFISSARCSCVNGIWFGSSSFSFRILEMSDNIQFAVIFAFLQMAVVFSNKLDRYLEAVNKLASLSDNANSCRYRAFLDSGNSGSVFLMSSMYSSDKRMATKSGSGK